MLHEELGPFRALVNVALLYLAVGGTVLTCVRIKAGDTDVWTFLIAVATAVLLVKLIRIAIGK